MELARLNNHHNPQYVLEGPVVVPLPEPQLVIHCGGSPATYNQLQRVDLPEQTPTYTPIPHHELVYNARTIAQDMLGPKGFTLSGESLALAREGQRFFGVLKFKGPSNSLGLSIGLRNSYDKTMKVGVCVGANVFVCDNLAFKGSVSTINIVHSGKAKDRLKSGLITTLYDADTQWREISNDAGDMQKRPFYERDFAHMLGFLFYKGVLQPTMLNPLRKAWAKPPHDWGEDSLWKAYNTFTWGLKGKVPIDKVVDTHAQIHRHCIEQL